MLVKSSEDLQQLRGVGRVLAKRLYDAGFDSFEKISEAGEEGLKKVRGLAPRTIASILQQSRALAKAPHHEAQAQQQGLKDRFAQVRERLQTLEQATRNRFQDKLDGKPGKKLGSDLDRMREALEQMEGRGKKGAKRTGKALSKAEKRVTGLEEASLKKVQKGVKKARKTMLKAL